MVRDFIDSMPLWGVLLTTVTIVWLATEAGFRTGVSRSNKPDFDDETQISSMTGANLGLLAFLLAFTFSMAAGHFDARKNIILEEAKVISTAHLRTTLLPGQSSERIAALLRDYTVIRSNISGDTDAAAVIVKSELLQAKMWQEIETLAAGGNLTVMHSLLIQSVNQVFDAHEDRIAAGLHNRIPPTIWIALYTVLLLAMLGMGFHSGMKGSRSPVPTAALALSFSMVLFLIADLDRPDTGLVTPDQSALVELNKRLQQVEQ